MNAKAKRRSEKRRKQEYKRRASVDLSASAELERPFRMIVEALDDLGEYLAIAEDPVAALALAELRVREAVGRLVEAAAPYDAFDVLEVIRSGNLLADPETFTEATQEGSAAVIEVVAIALAARGSREPVADTAVPQGEWGAADTVRKAAEDVVRAGSMLALFGVGASGDPLSRISFGTVLREAYVRNVAYPHMVEDTLSGLFGDPAIAEESRRVVGVTGFEIRAVFTALQALHEEAWDKRFDALRQIAEMARSTTPEEREHGLSDGKRAQGRALLESAWAAPASNSVFSACAVAEKAGVTEEVVSGVITPFSPSTSWTCSCTCTRAGST